MTNPVCTDPQISYWPLFTTAISLVGVAAYKTGILQAGVRKITSLATTTLSSWGTSIAKNQLYKMVCDYIENAEKETRTNQEDLLKDGSNGLSTLFAKNKELKDVIENSFSSQATIDLKFDELFEQIKSAKFYIHGISLNPDKQIHAPTLEEISTLHKEALNPQIQAQVVLNKTEEMMDHELYLELKKFTTCLRRKAEIFAILGDNAPQELNSTINRASEEAFQREFIKAIKNSIKTGPTPYFLHNIQYAYLISKKFFITLITKTILDKINKFLDLLLKNFIARDTAQIMDLITNILCSGFHLYTNEIINAAHELHKKSDISGTPDQMFETILSKKASLHKGKTQSKFYELAFDQILKYCFDWSISRWAIKWLAMKNNCFQDPFLSLSQNIKHANGYFYNIDKSIVRFINPIIQQMGKKSPGLNSGIQSPKATRNFSNINKDTLKKSIESLFEATDIYRSSNLSEIKKIVKRSDKSDREKSILEQFGLNIDTVLQQTAEAGATSLLTNISDVLNSSFLKENAISALKTLNAVFSTSAKISEAEYQAAERERKESLNKLTQVIIKNAVDNAPILNTAEVVHLLNAEIKKSKNIAIDIKNSLDAYTQPPKSDEEILKYPQEIMEKIIQDLKDLKYDLDKAASSDKYSDDQIQDLFAPYNELKTHILALEKAFLTQSTPLKNPGIIVGKIRECINNLQRAINSPVFAARDNRSVMDNPKVKVITTFVLNFMLRHKFNQAYEFICDFKTIKYCVIHQGILAPFV